MCKINVTDDVNVLELGYNGCTLRLTDLLSISQTSVKPGPTHIHNVVYFVDGTDSGCGAGTGIQFCLFDGSNLVASCEVRTLYYSHWVHPHAAFIRNQKVLLAVGKSVCSLSLSTLQLEWNYKADIASCLGVYLGSSDNVICHGECSISSLSLTGSPLWTFSGPDVFSGKFEFKDGIISAVDFTGRKFVLDERNGDLVH